MFKHKNKGLSYLELVVSITIGILLTAFFTITVTTAHRNNANRAKDKIEVSVKTARNNALSRGSENGWVNFYYKNNKLYCYIGKELDFDTNKPSLTSADQKWELVASNVSKFSFDGVDIPDGLAAGMVFKQSTGEMKGWKFPNSSGQPLHTPSDGYKVKIDVQIGNRSESSLSVDKFGTCK